MVKLPQVSPIEYGHVLLVPRVLDCLPQRIDHTSFFLALSLAREAADPFFRVGYNSLGAFATINHLHFQVTLIDHTLIHDFDWLVDLILFSIEGNSDFLFNPVGVPYQFFLLLQAYYLDSLFPVEKVPSLRVMTSASVQRNVVVSRLLKFPVRSLVFEGGDTLRDLSNAVANSCIRLQQNNIPFNVLISDCGKRVFLFPQVSFHFLPSRQIDSLMSMSHFVVQLIRSTSAFKMILLL